MIFTNSRSKRKQRVIFFASIKSNPNGQNNMTDSSKPSEKDLVGFSCKPDTLTFSVNNVTKCSFASTSLCNSSSNPLAFSVSSHLDGIFRIDPPSGVLKEGQTITIHVTMLHTQLLAASRAHKSADRDPQSLFNFNCVKILEGQGLRIHIRHAPGAAAAPVVARPLLPASVVGPTFPPVQPGNIILAGNLKKVNESCSYRRRM
jgi:hypothetical protein